MLQPECVIIGGYQAKLGLDPRSIFIILMLGNMSNHCDFMRVYTDSNPVVTVYVGSL